VLDLFEEMEYGAFHTTLIFACSGVVMSSGAATSALLNLHDAYRDEFKLGKIESSLLVSSMFLGGAFGSVLGGSAADTFGRRNTLLAASVLMIPCFFFIGISSFFWGPLIFRFLIGIGFGASVVVSMCTVQEWCAPSQRSTLILVVELMFCIGRLMANILVWIFMPSLEQTSPGQWRYVIALSAVPLVAGFPFLWFYLLETPAYFLSRGRNEEAVETISNSIRLNYGENSELLNFALSFAESSSASMAQDDDEENPESQYTAWQKLQVCFSSEFRFLVMAGCYLCLLSHFCEYGDSYAFPSIAAEKKYPLPVLLIMLCSFADIFATTVAYFISVDQRTSYRSTITIGLVLMLVAFSLVATVDIPGIISPAVVGFIVSEVVIALTLAVIHILFGELFPTSIRGTAFAFCIMGGNLGSILAPPIYESLAGVDPFKLVSEERRPSAHHMYFVVSILMCVVGIILVLNVSHENKGKILHTFSRQSQTEMQHRRTLRKSQESRATYGLNGESMGRNTYSDGIKTQVLSESNANSESRM